MKVLFLPKWYPNINDVQHGIFIKNQVLALSKKIPVAVLFVITSELVEEEKIEINKSENYTEIIIYFRKRANRLLGMYSYYQSFKKGVELLEKEWGKPDIVTLYILGRNYMMYKKFYTDIPFVISEQWSGYLNGGMEKYIYAKRKNTLNALKKADAIIAVSDVLAKSIHHYSNREINVIPNIVKSIPVSDNIIKDTIRILSVSDLDDSIKNISGIFSALKIASIKNKIYFKLIGEGKDEEKLRSFANENSNPNLTIEFIPRMNHEDLLKQYAWCNFYIINSFTETFNVAGAEACAAGRPVISTKCGGPEKYISYNNGKLIEVNSVPELSRAITEMIHDLESGKFKTQEVAQTINQSYGEEYIANQYFNMLKTTIDKKRLSSSIN